MTTAFLVLSCTDCRGIVADVAGVLSAMGGNILEAQQFGDAATGRFFMRIVFDYSASPDGLEEVRRAFRPIAGKYEMEWYMRPRGRRQKVLLLVSRYDHCLADLLYRMRLGELSMDVVGVVSNHSADVLESAVLGDIPHYHFPVTEATRDEQEARIADLVADKSAELVVLARYMQILSDRMAASLSGRCINIHHGFLPGFKGARPYHQAHRRGVKMIGATAHFVTSDLDEGPIITQEVVAVSHADSVPDLIRKGRNIEQRVLAHAVAAMLDGRVFLNGTKTVVL